MLLCLETAAEVPCFFKNFTVGLSPKKKDCANFSHALLSVLSTLGYAGLGLAPHSPVQALVWLHTVWFRLWFGSTQSGSGLGLAPHCLV